MKIYFGQMKENESLARANDSAAPNVIIGNYIQCLSVIQIYPRKPASTTTSSSLRTKAQDSHSEGGVIRLFMSF